ncbi:MAG: shikimate kinase [gamma proteobacterium symbiont of Phacoides pectinatus]
MNIVLIGMRGAGKSSISRRLSLLTKRPVISTDLLIEYENDGLGIPGIVAEQGWPAFREQEFRVIEKVTRLDNLIIDCGGGVIVDLDQDGNEIFSERKVSLLRASGRVVWLKGDIARLAARVQGDPSRPALDAVRSDGEVMRRRLPFYEMAADLVIDIETEKRKRLAKRIAAALAGL